MRKVLKTGGWASRCRNRRESVEISLNQDQTKNSADLYWLALLLTGRPDLSIDIIADAAAWDDQAHPFFANWMRAWSRRIVIAKALAAIRDELAASARRTTVAREHSPVLPHGWSLGSDMTKAGIEQALLAIDVFPRAAVLLLIFEGIRLADAATLLDADARLVRKAQAIGLRELTANLAGNPDCPERDFSQCLALAQAAN